MPSIQIKNVPDDVHRVLRHRAVDARQSLQEYLLAKLTEDARRPTLDEIFARMKSEKGDGRAPLDEVVRIIRADRDSR